MRNRGAGYSEAAKDGLRRLFLFLFFLAGAFVSQTGENACKLIGRDFVPTVWQYALCFGAAMLFSASVWGSILLPGCAFVFGCVTGAYVGEIVAMFYSGAGADIKGLLVNMAAVPLFFLAAVRGMRVSAMLGDMIDRYSAQTRAVYNREFIPMSLTFLVGIFFVYLLIA